MHGECYRKGNGQPYTRKKYIKGKPQIKIAKFEGGQKGDYDYSVKLLINEKIQIVHVAIEATRLVISDNSFLCSSSNLINSENSCSVGSLFRILLD